MPGTSTKPRAVEGSSVAGAEYWAVQRFFSVAQLTPIPCATREIDKTIVNETACSHNEGGIGVEEVVRR
jgi:hypothetical protein